MTRTSVAVFATCALLAMAVPARAQSPDPPNRFLHPSEVAPYVTSGGDATGVGATVRWSLTPRLSIQAEGEYRNGQRNFDRYLPRSSGLNGNTVVMFDLPSLWRITPFVVGGGGLEHRIDIARVSGATDLRWISGTSFVVNGGGGLRVALSDRVGARVELRYADGWAEGSWDSMRIIYGTTIRVGGR